MFALVTVQKEPQQQNANNVQKITISTKKLVISYQQDVLYHSMEQSVNNVTMITFYFQLVCLVTQIVQAILPALHVPKPQTKVKIV